MGKKFKLSMLVLVGIIIISSFVTYDYITGFSAQALSSFIAIGSLITSIYVASEISSFKENKIIEVRMKEQSEIEDLFISSLQEMREQTMLFIKCVHGKSFNKDGLQKKESEIRELLLKARARSRKKIMEDHKDYYINLNDEIFSVFKSVIVLYTFCDSDEYLNDKDHHLDKAINVLDNILKTENKFFSFEK